MAGTALIAAIYCLAVLLVGALPGFLAGKLVRGEGFGLIGNVLLGIAGSLIGALIFGLLGFDISETFVGWLVSATAGAVVLLTLANALFNREPEAQN
ncbi:MAG: GlsB/YeaQ/YmgE family stress response membrane protein [Chloroflexi bacterium]|nr:GlsB/YeaQ/YmgE family stress response membrane protein [Chloroflexota bacterium]